MSINSFSCAICSAVQPSESGSLSEVIGVRLWFLQQVVMGG